MAAAVDISTEFILRNEGLNVTAAELQWRMLGAARAAGTVEARHINQIIAPVSLSEVEDSTEEQTLT